MIEAMRVPDGSREPVVGAWTETSPEALAHRLGLLSVSRPAVLAVDGRSGAGKSTLAAALTAAVPDSAVVATDDVAWHFSMFDWADELRTHVIEPVRRGEPVWYRPAGWIARGRPGALAVAPERSVLIIEGVGSSQCALAGVLHAAIWVQSDLTAAYGAGIARDVASGVNGDRDAAHRFWQEWAAVEEPFLERDAPWDRAAVVVAGVPVLGPPELFGWVRADR